MNGHVRIPENTEITPHVRAPSYSSLGKGRTDIDIVSHKSHHNREWLFRWIVLLVIFVGVFSQTYCYDNPFALQDELQDKYGLSNVQYALLYSVYGYVNFIFPLISGILVDYCGINISTIIFYSFVVVGQSCWVFGTIVSSYPLMLIGRSLFGCGAESFHTSRKYFAYLYFIGKEYSFASGITLSASRLGSFSQSYVTTIIYDRYKNIVLSLSVGWILVIIAFIALSIFIYCRYRINRQNGGKSFISQHDNRFNLDVLWKNTVFDRRFYLLGFGLCFYYSTFLAYSTIGSSFIQAKYEYTFEYANSIAPIPFIISAIFTPLFGMFIDRMGNRCQYLLVSVTLYTIGHCILGFTSNDAAKIIVILGIACLGFGYALCTAILWPCFGLLYPKKYLATCLGVWGCIDNCLQATSFVIVGVIANTNDDSDSNDEYDNVKYYYLLLCFLCLISILLLWYYDAKMFGNVLSKKEAKYMDNDIINDKSMDEPVPDNAISDEAPHSIPLTSTSQKKKPSI